MINEVIRMQQLAGINEIKVNKPLSLELQKEFNEWTEIHNDEGLDNLYSGVFDVESDLTNREINNFRNSKKSYYIEEDVHYFWYNDGGQYNQGYSKLGGDIIDDDFGDDLDEIKVNKPTVKWSSVLQLITDLHKMNGRNSTNEDMMKIARKLGWRENGQTITTFFEDNPKKLPTFYSELKKLRKINEIKVTNLQPTPEKVTKLADNTRIISSLHPKISEIMNTYVPREMLEDESFKSWRDIFYQLPQPTLNKIYLELYKLTN